MRVWRLCAPAHADDPLGGRGGLYASGRWHSRGRRIVYTSQVLSLAALEILANADRALLPPHFVAFEIELPARLRMQMIGPETLPPDWQFYPAPVSTRQMGMAWLDQKKHAVLSVPSVVVPEERNYLINPLHPAAASIRVVGRRSFSLDPRLLPGE